LPAPRGAPRVDTLAKDIAVLDDDVPEIDPDPHGDAPLVRQRLVSFRDRVTQRRGAARSVNDTMEIGEHQFGGLLENIPAEFGDLRLDDLSQNHPQPGEAVGLLARQQPAVAGYQDCRRSTLDALSRLFGHDRWPPIARCGKDAPHLTTDV